LAKKQTKLLPMCPAWTRYWQQANLLLF